MISSPSRPLRPRPRRGFWLRYIARRTRADLALVVLYGLVVLVTVAIAVAAPRLVSHAGESGLDYTLTTQPERTDVVAAIDLDDSHYNVGLLDTAMAATIQRTTQSLHANLGDALAPVLAEPVATVTTRSLEMPRTGSTRASIRLDYVWAEGASGVTWIDGTAPGTSPANPNTARTDPVEVGLSEQVARALDIDAGEVVTLKQADNSVYTLAITGIFAAEDPDDPVWAHAPGLITPIVDPDNGDLRITAGALLGEQSLPVIRLQLPEAAMSATYTFDLIADAVDLDDIDPLSAAVGGLRSHPDDLVQNVGPSVAVASDLDDVLGGYAAQLSAAQSQAAVVGAALAVVSALALVVCGGLLAARRRAVVDLEVARGSTAAMVLGKVAVESAIITCAGTVLGAMLADAVVPGDGGRWLVAVEMIVALIASPLAVLATINTTGTPARQAANRADRRRARGVRHARRAVAEGAVVLLAVGASIAARARGVVDSDTTGIDPLVVAAPILLALAATIIAVRLMPFVLSAARTIAAHFRGAIGLVAAARASAAQFGGPAVTALTVSLGMIMVCGTLASTVASGQENTALARTGADVTVHADNDSLTAAAGPLADAEGIDAVVLGRVDEDTQVRVNDTVTTATVVIVDAERYSAQRDALGLTPLDVTHLRGTDATPGALVQRGTFDTGVEAFDVYWNDDWIPAEAVARIGPLPDIASPVVIIDAQQWADATGAPVRWDTMWVTGPRADAAVAAVPSLTDAVVVSRAAYLDSMRDSPLTISLTALLVAGVWIFALFGALVLVLWVLSSSQERSRTLSALRTLGLSRRAATAVSLIELLPSVVAALICATAISVVVPRVLGPSIGLESLNDGAPLGMTWSAAAFGIAAVVAAVALVITVSVESLLRRRTRLGQVLRVGAT